MVPKSYPLHLALANITLALMVASLATGLLLLAGKLVLRNPKALRATKLLHVAVSLAAFAAYVLTYLSGPSL